MKRTIFILTLVVLIFAGSALAADKVVVIPLLKNDPDIVPENIKCGVTINGVAGTITVIPDTVCSAGRIWMDRNLGATQVATSSTDTAAYGDLYQWGRLADGHEDRGSATTITQSTGDDPGHGDFIIRQNIPGDYPYDWRTTENDNLWQGISGINNPCPTGFRIPTEAEWEKERLSWNSNDLDGAYQSPLKLTAGGTRFVSSGVINYGPSSTFAGYWSSTVSTGNYPSIMVLAFNFSLSTDNEASLDIANRGAGLSVRCIKN